MIFYMKNMLLKQNFTLKLECGESNYENTVAVLAS